MYPALLNYSADEDVRSSVALALRLWGLDFIGHDSNIDNGCRSFQFDSGLQERRFHRDSREVGKARKSDKTPNSTIFFAGFEFAGRSLLVRQ